MEPTAFGLTYGSWSVILAVLGIFYAAYSALITNRVIKEMREGTEKLIKDMREGTEKLIKTEDERAKQIMERIDKSIGEFRKEFQETSKEFRREFQEVNAEIRREVQENRKEAMETQKYIAELIVKVSEAHDKKEAPMLRDKSSKE
jgi:gas vesicle protein